MDDSLRKQTRARLIVRVVQLRIRNGFSFRALSEDTLLHSMEGVPATQWCYRDLNGWWHHGELEYLENDGIRLGIK